MKKIFLASMLLPCAAAMAQTSASSHFDWNGATVYFVITDRFCNGDRRRRRGVDDRCL